MYLCTSCPVFTPGVLNSSTRWCSIFCPLQAGLQEERSGRDDKGQKIGKGQVTVIMSQAELVLHENIRRLPEESRWREWRLFLMQFTIRQ